ncbi:uncharacterized protein LOC119552705 [Drosophila subpulchrella]|uniref:uncharacterized protein LOC119552705 n=1 Tax=Drosophila subpulchrella TaxID=1486046 RepID=UPI0018A17D28|nr:uncharacterized protein LOC119552705 [Drosophila subpulchrella]
MAFSYSYEGRAQKMIKCFCGCSEISVEELLRIKDLIGRVMDILSDPPAAKLLREFMEERRSGDRNLAEQYLDIFEKCAQLKAQPTITTEDLDELINLGLPYELEKDLKDNRMESRDFLNRIETKCCNIIEASADFRDFELAIAKKVQQVPKEMK